MKIPILTLELPTGRGVIRGLRQEEHLAERSPLATVGGHWLTLRKKLEK